MISNELGRPNKGDEKQFNIVKMLIHTFVTSPNDHSRDYAVIMTWQKLLDALPKKRCRLGSQLFHPEFNKTDSPHTFFPESHHQRRLIDLPEVSRTFLYTQTRLFLVTVVLTDDRRTENPGCNPFLGSAPESLCVLLIICAVFL